MDMALYLSLVGFVIAMSATPGPNNLMLMSSSALFGVRRTVPHFLGVQIGFNLLLVAAVFGLGTLVARYPVALDVVKVGGSLWLAWMALAFVRAGLARPAEPGEAKAPKRRSRPFRTWEAALFQWVNPKALLMTISTAGAYIALADTAGERAMLFMATFLLFGAPCGLMWVLAGGVINRFLTDRRHARILNFAIAILLLATIAIILKG